MHGFFLTYVFVNPCYWVQCLPSAGSVVLVLTLGHESSIGT